MRPCKPSLAYPSEANEWLRGLLRIAWMEDGREERSADVSPAETTIGVARSRSLTRDCDDKDNVATGDNGDLDLNIDDAFKGSSKLSTGSDRRLWSRRRKLSSAIGADGCPAGTIFASSAILLVFCPWLSRRGLIIKKTGRLSVSGGHMTVEVSQRRSPGSYTLFAAYISTAGLAFGAFCAWGGRYCAHLHRPLQSPVA